METNEKPNNINTEKIYELHKLAWKKLRVGDTGEAWILYERRKISQIIRNIYV